MNDRIRSIADAAARLFLKQGYSKTQISHIAKAAGVSVGTIYLDFTGKKEILHLVVKCLIDPEFINQDFERPITDDLFKGLQEEVLAMLKRNEECMKRHLNDHVESYTFEKLISDVFDMMARYAVGYLFVEKNMFDFRAMAEYYQKCRMQFLEIITQYLRHFMENGTVRHLDHPELTATLIVETIAWWAMDLQYTSFETRKIPLELAKEVCMDNLITAYRSDQRAM